MRNILFSLVKLLLTGALVGGLYFTLNVIHGYELQRMPVDNSGYSDFYDRVKDRVISKEEGVTLRSKGDLFIRYSLNKDLFEKRIIFYRYVLLFPIGCVSLYLIGRLHKHERQTYLLGSGIYLSLVIGFGYIQPLFFTGSFILGAFLKHRKAMRDKDYSA